jgi:hypothetical protein
MISFAPLQNIKLAFISGNFFLNNSFTALLRREVVDMLLDELALLHHRHPKPSKSLRAAFQR